MTNQIELSRPFGPLFGKLTLTPELVGTLNKKLTSNLKDFSNNLVGKVSEEKHFDKESIDAVLSEIAAEIVRYHLNHHPEDQGNDMSVSVAAAWYVRQFENEYNPVHVHSGCTMSCVGYLALPEGIEEEFEEDEKDHHPANGRIEFFFGNATSSYTKSSFRIKPKVGEFYLFPNGLWHAVYPFHTKGERRSFSMNLKVSKKIEAPKITIVDN